MRRVYHHFGRLSVTIRIANTFSELGNYSTEVERIRYARTYILEMIEGYLMLDLLRNLVHLRWLLKLVDFRAAGKFSWGSTPKSEVAYHYYNHGLSFVFHFYVLK
ncbi:hypothetical protein Gotur_021561 [Gossypium turneri]